MNKSNVITLENFKSVIIPDDKLFNDGKPETNENIYKAVSEIYRLANFGKEWGFSIIIDNGGGCVERLNVEEVDWVTTPYHIVDAYFTLKMHWGSQCTNIYLCITAPIKTKKDLKMPKSARMIGRTKGSRP